MAKEPLELRVMNSFLNTKTGQKVDDFVSRSAEYLGPRVFGKDDILSEEELGNLPENKFQEYKEQRGKNILRVAKKSCSAAVLSFGVIMTSPLYTQELQEINSFWETTAPYIPFGVLPLLPGVFVASERDRRRKNSELTQSYREKYLKG